MTDNPDATDTATDLSPDTPTAAETTAPAEPAAPFWRTKGAMKMGVGLAAAALLGLAALGGAAIANATQDGAHHGGQHGPGAMHAHGGGFEGRGGPGHDGRGFPGAGGGPMTGGHDHTPVEDATLTKIKAAVKKYDDTYEVLGAMSDPDGSYDVQATKDGQPAMLDVSADLGTVTGRSAPPSGTAGETGSNSGSDSDTAG